MAKRSTLPVFVLVLLASGATYPQAYPSRPIRLIVPSAAGGQPDIVARLIANELGKQMGQQVVVDNRPGASSIIGFETIAKAPADGYTLGFAGFPIMTGTQITQVSYKGMPQATTDAMSGQVHLVCDNAGSILPHVKSGKLRALGVTTAKRSPVMPELPTIAEAGVPGYEIAPSAGYVVPRQVPRETVLRLNAEINKALQSPAVTERFAAMSLTIGGGTPEHFAEHLRSETAKWAKVIAAAGIKME